MELKAVTPAAYRELLPSPSTVFSGVDFTLLNRGRADEVVFLAAEAAPGRPACGAILGLRGGIWRAPFSAPYGELAFSAEPTRSQADELLDALLRFCGGAPLQLTLEPPFRRPEALQRIYDACEARADETVRDFNYHYPLDLLDDFRERMAPAARRNFRRAESAGFTFEQTGDIPFAYGIIAEHHRLKGYNMAMSLQQVVDTAAVVPTDFFILRLDGQPVAAAMVDRVDTTTAQLINWGDLDGYSNLRPMNRFAYDIFRHYRDAGFRYYDMGPASTDGIPNTGLCRFKLSLGCLETLKPTFRFNTAQASTKYK